MKAIFISGIAAICLSACVTASEVDTLIPQTVQKLPAGSSLANAVTVKKLSGKSNGAFEGQISSEALSNALSSALEQSGFLASEEGNYSVMPSLVHLEQPAIGIDMKVTAKLNYLLKDSSGKILLDKTISTPYTAKMGEAFVGATRVKRANEGAVRENISAFIGELITWSQKGVHLSEANPIKVNVG